MFWFTLIKLNFACNERKSVSTQFGAGSLNAQLASTSPRKLVSVLLMAFLTHSRPEIFCEAHLVLYINDVMFCE